MTTREQIIAAAKEAGFPEWENTDDPEFLKVIEKLYVVAFQSGAASRDAEVAELKTVPMKYRRMAFNAQLQAEVAELAKERDQFRAELVKALAACKLKDEALEHIALIDLGRDTLPTDFCMNVLSVRKALAIQPDDSALKAWLGEPVGEVKRHTGSLKDMAIIVWAGQQPEEGTKLYSPKGLK